VLDGGGWSAQFPGHFAHGNEIWYPLYRRLDGPQGWSSGWVWKIWPPLEFNPRTIYHVASCCTNCTIPTHSRGIMLLNNVSSWFTSVHIVTSQTTLHFLNTAMRISDMIFYLLLICFVVHIFHCICMCLFLCVTVMPFCLA
jgi:hypothetical protein